MKHISFLLFSSLISLNYLQSGQQFLVIKPNRIHVTISGNSLNRIIFENDRIQRIVGLEDNCLCEVDPDQGQLFLKTKTRKSFPLTIMTEKGITQDCMVEPALNGPETIVFKQAAQDKGFKETQEDREKILLSLVEHTEKNKAPAGFKKIHDTRDAPAYSCEEFNRDWDSIVPHFRIENERWRASKYFITNNGIQPRLVLKENIAGTLVKADCPFLLPGQNGVITIIEDKKVRINKESFKDPLPYADNQVGREADMLSIYRQIKRRIVPKGFKRMSLPKIRTPKTWIEFEEEVKSNRIPSKPLYGIESDKWRAFVYWLKNSKGTPYLNLFSFSVSELQAGVHVFSGEKAMKFQAVGATDYMYIIEEKK